MPKLADERLLDSIDGVDYQTEDGFRARYGSDYLRHWQRAPKRHYLLPWQEALKAFGLGAVDCVNERLTSEGGPFGKLSRGGTAREEARELLVQCLGHTLDTGEATMPVELAQEWVDAFLDPVGPEAELFTGTAETAAINTGVVFVLPHSVGCMWFGDDVADE